MSYRKTLKPIHPFPARMAPAIVWRELAELAKGEVRTPIRVLDPMAGSGTTIATARLFGHKALGFDTDPLAVLIAGAWSADVDPLALVVKASQVLERARARVLTAAESYPQDSDEETRSFVRYWFDLPARRQLAALAAEIVKVREKPTKDLLWCAFSRLLIVKIAGASLAMDVAHSRPHRSYERSPILPFEHFERAASIVAQNSAFTDDAPRWAARVSRADARDLPVETATIDCVITSPPYLNAIDYLRGHKFSLIWMGYSLSELRSLRSTNVGTEVSARPLEERDYLERVMKIMGPVQQLPSRVSGMLRRYVGDMDGVLSEVGRVLRPGGRAVFVVGDSTLKGVFVRNSRGLVALGERHNLKLVRRRKRPLPANRRYLPPPSADKAGELLQARMAEEVILTFSRGS